MGMYVQAAVGHVMLFVICKFIEDLKRNLPDQINFASYAPGHCYAYL